MNVIVRQSLMSKIRTLSPQQVAEVESFVEFLAEKAKKRAAIDRLLAYAPAAPVDFGKAGLIDKARQQPDKVRVVLDKIRTDGLMPTLQAVRNKLDQPLPMGYCNVGVVGVVAEVGAGVSGFAVGDRVASNGKHAEAVSVGTNGVRVVQLTPQ